MEVFVVAGEPSGDRQGAALADEIRRLEPRAAISGVGGRAMKRAGVSLMFDSADWGAIGVPEALRRVPSLWLKCRAILRRLRSAPPAVLVLIDFGAFNLRLARALQGRGIPILYYFPPRSWSRAPTSGGLTDLVDAIATPFPWSESALSGGRAVVRWVGHPLVEQVRPRAAHPDAVSTARERWGIRENERLVLVAPGSRDQELRIILPELTGAAAVLRRDFPSQPGCPSLRFAAAAAPGVSQPALRRRFQRLGIEPIVAEGLDPDLLRLADLALVTSGTATLELTILGVPMVVVYRVSLGGRLQYAIMCAMGRRVQFVAMPNIMAQRMVVPELLQERARAGPIAAEARRLLADDQARQRMRAELLALAAQLGPPGAARRAAEMALALAKRRPIETPSLVTGAATDPTPTAGDAPQRRR
jgi:lipid-A-disaccharide synthase